MSRLKLREQRPPSIRGARLKDDLPKPGIQLGTASNKPGAEPGTVLESIQVTGLQEKILKYVFERCRDAGSLRTGIITKSELRKICGGTTEGLKRAIQKIEERGYLRRLESQPGIFGGVSFEIFDSMFQKLTLQETRYKPGTGLSTGGGGFNNRSSSSSENEQPKFNAEWKEIDPSALSKIGFTQTHVMQIAHAGHLSPKEVQDSILHFAFELDVSKKEYGSPLNYFMKCLRNGPYAPPEGYESPALRARRLYVEAQEQERKKWEELEARLEATHFEQWNRTLTVDEKKQLVPPKEHESLGGPAYTSNLKRYFRETVWPTIQEKISREISC